MKQNREYLTVKDGEGLIRPMAVLWPTGENQKYFQVEINKYLEKGKKEGLKLVKVKITEIDNNL